MIVSYVRVNYLNLTLSIFDPWDLLAVHISGKAKANNQILIMTFPKYVCGRYIRPNSRSKFIILFKLQDRTT